MSQTHFAPHETRRVFEDNVELSVSVANTSSSPVIVEHMNRDKRVVLKAADGTESPLHPFSVGVAKPILLHPGEKTQTRLLFKPLKGEAQSLEIYDESTALTHATESFKQGAAK